MSGLFITLEGGEGVGKSTQARLLADALTKAGHAVLHTREPGGAPGAEQLRRFLLEHDHGLSLRAETLVHFAARLDHVERTVRPALAQGRLVVCDRFCDSTLAYQGYGLGHGDSACLDFIAHMITLTALEPDLTLLLDLPRADAQARMDARGRRPDRYEALDEAFHQRVSAGFRQIAARAPARIVPIDASVPVDLVHQALLREVTQRLPL